MSDKEFYQIIADELKSKTMDAALWTQAFATAEGNPEKTEVAYIRLRFQDLKRAVSPALQSESSNIKKAAPVRQEPSGELIQLRANLTKKLSSQGRLSLYSTLGLHPDASEAAVATAIADMEARGLAGADISAAEFNYAKGTLGNAAFREQYDRKLFDSLNERTIAVQSYGGVAMQEYSWWESKRMSLVIGVVSLALFSYLGLNYFKERNNREKDRGVIELQKESLKTEREVSISVVDVNQAKVQADIEFRNQALRAAEERQRQELQYRTSATDRLLEQQRLEQERRAQVEQQRLALQQEQAEKLRVSREKQYYACLNQYLSSQANATNADAYARCAMYR